VYQIITERIIEQLEKGVLPWEKPWADAGIPQNLLTKRPYRGINLWLLSMLGYERNYFVTFKQLRELLGGKVKKGEKAIPVIFWHWKEVTDEDSGEVRKIPFLRYYLVFNVSQCTGIEDKVPGGPMNRIIDPVEECERVIAGMPNKPAIKHAGDKAFYNPLKDVVNIPKMNAFDSSEGYYNTIFHELVHSTGHPARLNRRELVLMTEFGSEPYSVEELTAEMGTCYLMSFCGFNGKNVVISASYIGGWLEKLKNDKRFVIYAAAKAQQAVDFILNVQTKPEENVEQRAMEDEQSADIPF